MQNGFPTSSELRRMFLARFNRYCRLTGTGQSVLSKQLTNNPAFIQWFTQNGNVTFRLWDQCMKRLAKLERKAGITSKSPSGHALPRRKRKKRSNRRPSKPVGSAKDDNARMTTRET